MSITGGGITEVTLQPDMTVLSPTGVVSLSANTASTALTFNSPSGGIAPYTHVLTTTGGTLSNAAVLNPTLSGLVNGGRYTVVCVSRDAAIGVANQAVIQTIVVVVAEGNPTMESAVTEELIAGTTSKAVSFSAATGGVLPYTYSLSLTPGSSGTLVANSGNQSGTISGLADSDVTTAVCTVTDGAGRTASTTKSYGIGVTPGATYAAWEPVETIDFRTFSGTYTATATVSGRTFTMSAGGSPGTKTYSFNATTGMDFSISTGGTGNYATLSIPLNHLNFKRGETFILEFLIKISGAVLNSGAQIFVASTQAINQNNQLGFRITGTGTNAGNFVLRKYTGSTITESPSALTTFSAVDEWYSVQLIINEGSILYGSFSKSSALLDGYSFNSSNIGAGTWSGYLGGIAKSIGSVPAGPFESALYFNVTTTQGTHVTSIRQLQVLRATRPVRG
jgi:hypothetical protein